MPATASYEPRDPAQSILFQVVRDHFETFRRQAASLRDGEGLPRFVELEFREFLTCGYLAAGFARFHCDACGHDRLVPFSCKGRGFCPSCGGRGEDWLRQPARRRLSVGGVDAADVRDRRAGVPALRRAAAADGAHRV